MLCLLLGLPAFSPVPGVGRSRWGKPAKPAKVRMTLLSSDSGASGGPVPLTGQTLQAALKMRCDTTGAQYSIYWSAQGGKLQATGVYASTPSAAQYTKESQQVFLDAGGQGPIAQVQRSGQPNFIPDVRFSNLKRKELALKYGISQVSMQPFEAGVIEFGNSRTSEQWAEMPDAPVLPKAPIRTAFEDLGALYVMFWKADFANNELKVTGFYENPRDAKRRLALRGDGAPLGSGLGFPLTLTLTLTLAVTPTLTRCRALTLALALLLPRQVVRADLARVHPRPRRARPGAGVAAHGQGGLRRLRERRRVPVQVDAPLRLRQRVPARLRRLRARQGARPATLTLTPNPNP